MIKKFFLVCALSVVTVNSWIAAAKQAETNDWVNISDSVASFTGGLTPKLPGQFLSVAWDPTANILYASRMGSATFRLQLAVEH